MSPTFSPRSETKDALPAPFWRAKTAQAPQKSEMKEKEKKYVDADVQLIREVVLLPYRQQMEAHEDKGTSSRFMDPRNAVLDIIDVIKATLVRFPSSVIKEILCLMLNVHQQPVNGQALKYTRPPTSQILQLIDILWDQIVSSPNGFKGSYVLEVEHIILDASGDNISKYFAQCERLYKSDKTEVGEFTPMIMTSKLNILRRHFNMLLYSGGASLHLLHKLDFVPFKPELANMESSCSPPVSHSFETLRLDKLIAPLMKPSPLLCTLATETNDVRAFVPSNLKDIRLFGIKFLYGMFVGQC